MEPDDTPRKLARSTTDKYVSGVAGGLGRYFGVDPTLFRVAFGVSMIFGGIGILAYIALLAFLPNDLGEPAWIENKSRPTTIIVVALIGICAVTTLSTPKFLFGPGIFVVAAVTILGAALYRGFGGARGDDPARVIARITLVLIAMAAALGTATGVGFVATIGGGVAVAVIGMAAGFGLIAAGLLGGPRWLILPVIVLVLPLAVVSAADIDLTGGVGHKEYRPASLADLRPEYRIGLGQVDLDLRDVTLPAGRTQVNVRVGIGEARVRVPRGACVATDAQIGVGAADLPERADEGADIEIDQSSRPSAGKAQLLVKADVGVGHLQIDRDIACA